MRHLKRLEITELQSISKTLVGDVDKLSEWISKVDLKQKELSILTIHRHLIDAVLELYVYKDETVAKYSQYK